MKASLMVSALLLVACRTEISPIVRGEPHRGPRAVEVECTIHDYASATDVPEGATNIGWIIVPREATDDETFTKLRAALCSKGANAFSQAHWNRAAGASVADAPIELEANAWDEPR